MASNAVLNVDQLLQVFLWEEVGNGEMVRTPLRSLFPSIRSGIASTSEEEKGPQEGLAPNLTFCQWQGWDVSLGL